MSVLRPKPPEDPIAYRPSASSGTGIRATAARDDGLEGWLERLDFTRTAVVADPPERLLEDYTTAGARGVSELFRILQTASQIRDTVDRVIVVGDGCSALAAQASFESCAHPFHNELSRGERGGRPRLSFVGSPLDRDRLPGLLDLVAPAGTPRSDDVLDQWAILLLGADTASVAQALSIGAHSVFPIPEDVGAEASVFTAAGLLPAAIAGIDVVRLLQGATAMNRRFREAPVAENPVLQFAAAAGMAKQGMDAAMRLSAGSHQSLETLCRWHDRLRGLPDGRAALFTDLSVAEPRRGRLAMPDMPVAAEPIPPRILLPRVDEHAVGQLLQMLSLATLFSADPATTACPNDPSSAGRV